MKKQPNILKMINLMLETGADLTPKEDNSYDKSRNYEGINIDDLGKDDRWGVALLTQVDDPEMYEHICYGIYRPQETQTSEY